MRRRRNEFTLSVVMALAFVVPELSQAPPSKSSTLPVKVQVVVTKGEGDKTPYTFFTTSSGEVASVRLGSEVPIATAVNAVNGTTIQQIGMTIQQIGMQIDCTVRPVDDAGNEERYKVAITITKRDVYDQKPSSDVPQKVSSMPTIFNFVFAGTLVLVNGGTAQISGTDILTNETWRADVTLSVKK